MNKRTVILISICFLLVVATLTIRSIEQEKESIKSQFVGEKQTEERLSKGAGSARQALPQTQQSESAVTPMRQEPAAPPLSGDEQQPPDVLSVPGSAFRDAPVSSERKTVSTTTAFEQDINVVEGTVPFEMPETAAIEDVTTPLEPDERIEMPDNVPGAEVLGGVGAERASRTEEGGENGTVAESVDDGDPVEPAAEEQPVEAEEEAGMDKTGAAAEDDEMSDEEIIGEEEPFAGEEAVEDDEVFPEEEFLEEEGDAMDQTEEGIDEE